MANASSFEDDVKQATVFQWNARGLPSRLSDFRQFVFKYRFPILAICESRVAADFRLSGYEVFQSARDSGISRLFLALRKDLTYVHHDVPSHPNNEYVSVTVRRGKVSFTIIASYVAPSCVFDVSRLNAIIRQCPGPILLTGDFNAHNAAWGSAKTTRRGRELLDLAYDHDLCVLNDGPPTFVRGTRSSSCLDVAFVSREIVSRSSWFVDVECHGSDHIPTYTTISGFQVNTKPHSVLYTDWKKFKDGVEVRLQTTGTYHEFISAIQLSAKEATKAVHLSPSRTTVDAEYERLRAIRRRAERRARRTKLPADIRNDRRTQKHMRRHLNKLSKKKWRRTCASFDPRASLSLMWHIARGLRSAPQQRTPFNALSIFLRRPALAIAEDFCASLVGPSTVNAIDPTSVSFGEVADHTSRAMDNMFSAFELDQVLASLNHSSSPGPDGITYGTLAHLGPQARQHLLDVFNASWPSSCVAQEWKTACVVPILKVGKSPLDIKSYRPIALTSCIGKCLERMILSRLEWFLESNSLYPESMTGFRQGRSSIDNVIDLVAHVDDQKLRGKLTTAVFLDIRGAFDNVQHSAVLQGLRSIGIGGRLYDWIADYLHNRTIFVRMSDGDTMPPYSHQRCSARRGFESSPI